MAILAYLSRRRAALRGDGMRSNCADSFRASQLRSGLRIQAAPSRKSGTHCAAEKPHQRAPNRTGTVTHDLCAGPLRRAFAHDLCASSLSNISLLNLWLDHYHGRFQCCTRGGIQCCTREGVQCCTRGGQNGGSDPPVWRIPLGTGPPWLCAARGSGASLPTGGVAPAIVILAGRLGFLRARAA